MFNPVVINPDTNVAEYFAFLSQRRAGDAVQFSKIVLRH